MATILNEAEKKEPEWWCRHHKANVLHLCSRIESMIEAIEGDNQEKWEFQKHDGTSPAFIESATGDSMGYKDEVKLDLLDGMKPPNASSLTSCVHVHRI